MMADRSSDGLNIKCGSSIDLVANNSVKSAVNISRSLDAASPVTSFEDGRLYQAGDLKVLELHGRYREMGGSMAPT